MNCESPTAISTILGLAYAGETDQESPVDHPRHEMFALPARMRKERERHHLADGRRRRSRGS